MADAPVQIPSSEIIDDLLTDNWELRFQVLDIFHQVRAGIKTHARTSPQHRAADRLAGRIIDFLQSETDVNLHLIILAVALLGGPEKIVRVFRRLRIDDPLQNDSEFSTLTERILRGERGTNFFHYFHYLFSRGIFPYSAIVICLRLFTPTELITLFCAMPDSHDKESAFLLLGKLHADHDFNPRLLADGLDLPRRHPPALALINQPAGGDDSAAGATLAEITTLVEAQLDPGGYRRAALEACRRIGLHALTPRLTRLLAEEGDDDRRAELFYTIATLGSTTGLDEALKGSRSLLPARCLAAVERLARYRAPEAVNRLSELATSRRPKIRRTAVNGLITGGNAAAVPSLMKRFAAAGKKEQLELLTGIARRRWTGVDTRLLAPLAAWVDNPELAPAVLEACEALGGENLLIPLIERLPEPLKDRHHKALCLAVARLAGSPRVKKLLLPHLLHPDWGFSCELLNRLRPFFTINDFPLLFRLLELRESYRPLTVRERLELGKGDDEFIPAMCRYLNEHPQVVNRLLFRLVNQQLTRKPPQTASELDEVFSGHPPALRKVIFSALDDAAEAAPEQLHTTRLFCRHLHEITVDGVDCFALMVNKTRRYSGFFTRQIMAIVTDILEGQRTSTDAALLPHLEQLLAVLHQRDGIDHIRRLALDIKRRIYTMSRDLYVYVEASRYRDLRVYSVRKVNG